MKIILLTIISGMSTVVGNIFLLIPKKYKNKIIPLTLSLSFITIFLISIFDLIPNALALTNNHNKIITFIKSLLLLMIGYSIVKKIDKKTTRTNSLHQIGILSTITLIIHNIPEGIICVMSSLIDYKIGLKMLIIIMIHNIPEGISISLPIYYGTKSKLKAITYTIISGLGELVGAIITMLFLKPYITETFLYTLLLITSGIMIYLSIKLLKESQKYQNKYYIFIGIISGVVIFILSH